MRSLLRAFDANSELPCGITSLTHQQADEIYYALLMGSGGLTIYGVNVTHGGEVISTDTPWQEPGEVPSFAHWLPTQP
jgi:hypothetical protein